MNLMNLKLGGLAVCLLLLVGMAFAQDENATNISAAAVNSAAIEARYENVKYGYERTLAAMDIVIQYFGNRTGAEVLSELRGNFTAAFEGLQPYVDANDPSGFGRGVAGMHQTAAQFKAETARLAEPGEMAALKDLVKNKVATTEAELSEVRESARAKLANAYGLVCKLNLERVRAFVSRLTAQNVSAEDIEALRLSIEEKCQNLTDIRNETQLRERIRELREDFNATRANILVKARLANEKAMERAITVVNALENRGVNVSGVKEKLQTIESLKVEAEQACANVTDEVSREACKESVEALREEASSIGEQIRIIARSNATGKVSAETGERVKRGGSRVNVSEEEDEETEVEEEPDGTEEVD